jgi:hypothetical protein
METQGPAASSRISFLIRLLHDTGWGDLRHVAARTALAGALVVLTTVVIYALVPVVDLRHVPAVYFLPVLAATLYWGLLDGLFTAFASAFAAAFFFYDPIFSFYIANPVEVVGLLIFVAAAIVIGYLATELRETRRARAKAAPPQPVARVENGAVAAVEAPANGTVPERVKDFIVLASGASFCDSCIQDRLGLKWRQQVQLITATLAVTDTFQRKQGQCSGCGESKQVINAV